MLSLWPVSQIYVYTHMTDGIRRFYFLLCPDRESTVFYLFSVQITIMNSDEIDTPLPLPPPPPPPPPPSPPPDQAPPPIVLPGPRHAARAVAPPALVLNRSTYSSTDGFLANLELSLNLGIRISIINYRPAPIKRIL